MELSLFDQVSELVRALVPDGFGDIRARAHRRGVKVWFATDRPTRDHYEAQLLARRHVDGRDGMALEIGFHAEHPDEAANQAIVERLEAQERRWRKTLGESAEADTFYGADNWRRVSEAWIEPDVEDPELPFEVASRLVDYIAALEPLIDR